MQVSSFEAYLAAFQECPDIATKVKWVMRPEELHYWFTPDDSLTAISTELNKFHEIRAEFTIFAAQYDTSMKDMRNRMKDVDFKIDNTIKMAKGLQKKFQETLNQATAANTLQIKNLARSQYDEFKLQMDKLKENMGNNLMDTWKRYWDDALTTINEVTNRINKKADEIIENAHNELYGILEKVTESFQDQAQQDNPAQTDIHT
jgi:hypothetical protein